MGLLRVFARSALCALLLAQGACARGGGPAGVPALGLDHLLKSSQVAGAIVAIARDGRLAEVHTYGYRNLHDRTPVDPDTHFEIGSITKQFTAAAILQLKEQRKLSLDEKLSAFLPAFPHAAEMTLRQLLYQTSGLPDYTEMPHFAERMSESDAAAAGIAAFVSRPLDFKPGTKWEYSSTNYYVLGRVIAIVSHTTYDDYVRAHLFMPAAMRHSGFLSEEPRMQDFARPYVEGVPAPPTRESWAGGAGSIVSTAGDLVAWDTALASRKIISRRDYVLMTSPAHLAGGAVTDYGMGISIDRRDGHRRLWHNGATNGSVAINSVYPADGVDIVVLENSAGTDPGTVERFVLDRLFPDALATARRPAKGETRDMRRRILPMIDGILSGTLPVDRQAPVFRRFWLTRRNAIRTYFAPFGPPQRETFKGSFDDGSGVWYRYRVEFAQDVRDCDVEIDKKSKLLENIAIAPPG